MKSTFSPTTGEWNIGWPGRVSRHDVVYLTPPGDPTQGMPLGNGDTGALIWCEDSRLMIAFNKCDLWDDDEPSTCASSLDSASVLRHGCRIIVDFHAPIFDVFYLRDFSGRLSLSDASASFDLVCSFGKLSFKAFVSHEEGVLVCRFKTDFAEEMPVDITVERFASFAYPNWYAFIDTRRTAQDDPCETAAGEDGIYITKRLTSGRFAAGCLLCETEGAEVAYRREHSHAGSISVSGSAQKSWTLMAGISEPASEDPTPRLRAVLSTCAQEGRESLWNAHLRPWKEFWLRSFMESGDEYLDNLWHLTMYYAASSQRGRRPGRFINGLWSWNRDVAHWGYYFHWNQQMTYWPLSAAGHHDLLKSYLNFRFEALPGAIRDAKELFGVDGAFVSDVVDYQGRNSLQQKNNHTPVAQIAMDFYRQYRYTCDLEFLKAQALPYMIAAAKFLASRFEKMDDGKYHAKEATAYEGYSILKDAITELAAARDLFPAVLSALGDAGISCESSGLWRDIASNLAELPRRLAGSECMEEHGGSFILKRGMFAGESVPTDKILAAGFGVDAGKMLSSKNPSDKKNEIPSDIQELISQLERKHSLYTHSTTDMELDDGLFAALEHSPIFTHGDIGFGERGSDEYNAACATVKLHAPDLAGFDTLPVVLARLGLADEFRRVMDTWADRWQFYCNGFGHYGPRDIQKSESSLRFRIDMVVDGANPPEVRDTKKKPFSTWPFRHMGMESMSVLSCATNESLLDAHDGIIRIGLAARRDGRSRFTLHAPGGFVVSSEIVDGKPLWVHVLSLHGKACRIASPWESAWILRDGRRVESREDVLVFEPRPGESFLLAPNEGTLHVWEAVSEACAPNAAPKQTPSGRASLGLPRMF